MWFGSPAGGLLAPDPAFDTRVDLQPWPCQSLTGRLHPGDEAGAAAHGPAGSFGDELCRSAKRRRMGDCEGVEETGLSSPSSGGLLGNMLASHMAWEAGSTDPTAHDRPSRAGGQPGDEAHARVRNQAGASGGAAVMPRLAAGKDGAKIEQTTGPQAAPAAAGQASESTEAAAPAPAAATTAAAAPSESATPSAVPAGDLHAQSMDGPQGHDKPQAASIKAKRQPKPKGQVVKPKGRFLRGPQQARNMRGSDMQALFGPSCLEPSFCGCADVRIRLDGVLQEQTFAGVLFRTSGEGAKSRTHSLSGWAAGRLVQECVGYVQLGWEVLKPAVKREAVQAVQQEGAEGPGGAAPQEHAARQGQDEDQDGEARLQGVEAAGARTSEEGEGRGSTLEVCLVLATPPGGRGVDPNERPRAPPVTEDAAAAAAGHAAPDAGPCTMGGGVGSAEEAAGGAGEAAEVGAAAEAPTGPCGADPATPALPRAAAPEQAVGAVGGGTAGPGGDFPRAGSLQGSEGPGAGPIAGAAPGSGSSSLRTKPRKGVPHALRTGKSKGVGKPRGSGRAGKSSKGATVKAHAAGGETVLDFSCVEATLAPTWHGLAVGQGEEPAPSAPGLGAPAAAHIMAAGAPAPSPATAPAPATFTQAAHATASAVMTGVAVGGAAGGPSGRPSVAGHAQGGPAGAAPEKGGLEQQQGRQQEARPVRFGADVLPALDLPNDRPTAADVRAFVGGVSSALEALGAAPATLAAAFVAVSTMGDGELTACMKRQYTLLCEAYARRDAALVALSLHLLLPDVPQMQV